MKIDMETTKNIIAELRRSGCCLRCILRHLDIKDSQHYVTISSASEKLALLEENSLPLPEGPVMKKERQSSCILCMGILMELCDTSIVSMIIEEIKKEDFFFDDFVLSLTIPSCCQIREHLTRVFLKKKYPSLSKDSVTYVPSIKEVWKWIIGPIIEKEFNVTFNVLSSFDIIINMEFAEDQEECKASLKLLNHEPELKRKSKTRNSGYSRAVIEKLLNSLEDNDVLTSCTWPPAVPTSPSYIQKIQCSRRSLFFAGRYNKYSRTLCQTPWMIDGEKLMATSIKEIICDYLISQVKAQEIKFSASGREDVDVRTLGKGRPFVLEFVNPRRIKFSPSDMMRFQKEINASTTDIAVRDLQIVSREDVSNLKEGEEEKTKVYSALCVCRQPYDIEKLNSLSNIKDLVIAQKTPIRVLHRRPFAIRERIIHEMKAEPIDKFSFNLLLKTQAGTYIKEYVHSDFGRTHPNLGILLENEVDILELDVKSVDLNWPPEIIEVQDHYFHTQEKEC